MITGIAHACFRVRNLETSIHFYEHCVGLQHGFDFIDEDGHRYGVYLRIGERNFLELFEDDSIQPTEHQSFGHVCLEVDDIEKTVATLRARGVKVSDPEMGGDGSWQAWFSDPDDNQFELHAYTPESLQTRCIKNG